MGVNIFENPILPEEIKQKIKDNENADFTFRYDFSKINKYYQPNSTTGFIDLTTKVTTLYDHNHEPINYLLINVDKTEDTIAYNKIQEFESFRPGRRLCQSRLRALRCFESGWVCFEKLVQECR